MDKQLRQLGRVTLQVHRDNAPFVKAASREMNATCEKGCAACCHQLVWLSLPEAIAIADHLLTAPEWRCQLPLLTERLNQQLTILEDSEITRQSYFALRQPCVFLGPQNLCRVYAQRPTACRYYYVVTEPALCGHPSGSELIASIDLTELETRVISEGLRASQQAGLPVIVAPLPVILFWALRLLQEGREAFDIAMASVPKNSALDLTRWMELSAESPLAEETIQIASERAQQRGRL